MLEDVMVFPISFSQQHLWFLDQLGPGNELHTVSSAVHFSGELSAGALERAIDAVVERHASLRTTFEVVDGQPSQIVRPKLAMRLIIADCDSTAGLQCRARDLCRSFDLAQG